MHKVIFDTDPGVDDAMALLFLQRHSDIEIVGITTVFGNASVDNTTRNALFLKSEFAITAPVARGADRTFAPDRKEAPWPTFVHGHNGLGDIEVPASIEGVREHDVGAARFIVDTVRASPGEITLIAVGRMTNLAEALRIDPGIAELVKQVIIMGGSFYAPGNVTPVAEANIHGDPEAADVVMTAAWPVTIVPLDVTHHTAMSRTKLAQIAQYGGSPARLLNDLSQDYIKFYSRIVEDSMLIHDACTCVYLVAPHLFETKTGSVRVVCGGLADGQTVLKPDGRRFPPNDWDGRPSQTVCLDVDAKGVLSLIEKTLIDAK